MTDDNTWITVRTYSGWDGAMVAEQARLTLTGHDIESLLLDSMTAGIDPRLGVAAKVRVQVRAADATQARELLKEEPTPAGRRRTARPVLGLLVGMVVSTVVAGAVLPVAWGALRGVLALGGVYLGWRLGREFDRDVCTKCGTPVETSATRCPGCRRVLGS